MQIYMKTFQLKHVDCVESRDRERERVARVEARKFNTFYD